MLDWWGGDWTAWVDGLHVSYLDVCDGVGAEVRVGVLLVALAGGVVVVAFAWVISV